MPRKSPRKESPWATIHGLAEARGFQKDYIKSAKRGDFSSLSRLLRSQDDLGYEVRCFLADILDGCVAFRAPNRRPKVLSDSEMLQVRKLYKFLITWQGKPEGKVACLLAKLFGVSVDTIRNAAKGSRAYAKGR